MYLLLFNIIVVFFMYKISYFLLTSALVSTFSFSLNAMQDETVDEFSSQQAASVVAPRSTYQLGIPRGAFAEKTEENSRNFFRLPTEVVDYILSFAGDRDRLSSGQASKFMYERALSVTLAKCIDGIEHLLPPHLPLRKYFEDIKKEWEQEDLSRCIVKSGEQAEDSQRNSLRKQLYNRIVDLYNPLSKGFNPLVLDKIWSYDPEIISPSKKSIIIRYSPTLLENNYEEYEIDFILQALASLSEDQIRAIAEIGHIIFKKDSDSYRGAYSRRNFIELIGKLNLSAKEIISRAVAVEENSENLFSQDLKEYEFGIDWLTGTAFRYDAQEIEMRVRAAFNYTPILFSKLFSENLDPHARARVLSAAIKQDPEKLSALTDLIIENSGRLFTENMDNFARAQVTAVALGLGVQELNSRLDAIVKNASVLFVPDMDGYTRADIMSVALQWPAEEINLHAEALSSRIKDDEALEVRIQTIQDKLREGLFIEEDPFSLVG